MKQSHSLFALRYSHLWAWIEMEIGSVVLYMSAFPPAIRFKYFIPVLLAAFILMPAFLTRWILKNRLFRHGVMSYLANSSLIYGLSSIFLISWGAFYSYENFEIGEKIIPFWIYIGLGILVQTVIFFLMLLVKYLIKK